ALGVIFGAFLHMAIQIPSAIASGFKYAPIFNLRSPELKRVFVLLLPRTLGAAASQINTVVITAFASTLISGSVAIFNFANNLRGFPIVLIGLSLATATFPYLSRTWAKGEKKEFLESLFSSFRQTLFLIIPTSVFMFFLSTPLVELILGGGRFGAIDTELTAAAIRIFSLGVFAFALLPLLNKAFFSFQNTKTPVVIGMVSVVFNAFFCYFFVWLISISLPFQALMRSLFSLKISPDIRVIGLSLGFLISGLFNFFALYIFLNKKLKTSFSSNEDLFFGQIRKTNAAIRKILLAAGAMAGCFYFFLKISAPFIGSGAIRDLLLQLSLAGILGGSLYLLVSFFLKSEEMKSIKNSLTNK
ncbi:MAG: lipid II flippase MurJ, partial [bacterium]